MLNFLGLIGVYAIMKVKITWVTNTSVCAPVITAMTVLRANVGVTGVSEVTAFFNTNLHALSHVHIGHIGSGLSHAHSL